MSTRIQFALLLAAVAVAIPACSRGTNPPPPAVATNSTPASSEKAAMPEPQARSFLGQKAPKFEVDKWLGHEPSMQGKFVLIDFWATWCVPCRQSIPELNGFHQKFKDRLVIVGITDETAEEVRKTTLPHAEYSLASDPDERIMRALGLEGLPYSILIDPSGIVRYEGSPLSLDEKRLRSLLDSYTP